jgi:ABC-type transporter Mla maintaining outer membrane lipid asymmetry ATPase subunit MlaF
MKEIEYAVEFNHLTKTFGEHTVLDSLDFNIHRGKLRLFLVSLGLENLR